MVGHTCNPSCLGDEDLKSGQKVIEIPSQQTSQAWWCEPVIPAHRAIGRSIVVQGQSRQKP
jgi:hypothetical protein